MIQKNRFHVKLLVLLFLPSSIILGQKFSTSVMQVKPLPALPPRDQSIASFVSSFSELKGSSREAFDWFYWTNYSRLRPKAFWDSVVVPLLEVYPQLNTSYATSLKRDLYRSQGLLPIRHNVSLSKAAQSHANDLSRNSPGSISHTSTNGASFEQRISKSGIQNCAAENLNYGPFSPVLSLVLLYLDQGLPNVGHRKNLLNPYYTEMGVGIAKSKGNSFVVVQDFACDQPR